MNINRKIYFIIFLIICLYFIIPTWNTSNYFYAVSTSSGGAGAGGACPPGQQKVGNACKPIKPTGGASGGGGPSGACPPGQQKVGNACKPIKPTGGASGGACPPGQQKVGNACKPIKPTGGAGGAGAGGPSGACPPGQQKVGNVCKPIKPTSGSSGPSGAGGACPPGQQKVGNACKPIASTKVEQSTIFMGPQASSQAKAAAKASKVPTLTVGTGNAVTNVPVSSQTVKVVTGDKTTNVPSLTVGNQTAIVVNGIPVYGTVTGGVFKPLANQSTASVGLVGLMTNKGGVTMNPAAAQMAANFVTSSVNKREVPGPIATVTKPDAKGNFSANGVPLQSGKTYVDPSTGKGYQISSTGQVTTCTSHPSGQLRALFGGNKCGGNTQSGTTAQMLLLASAVGMNLFRPGPLQGPATGQGSGSVSFAMSEATQAYSNNPRNYQSYAQSMIQQGIQPISLQQWTGLGNNPPPILRIEPYTLAGAVTASAAGLTYAQYTQSGGRMTQQQYNSVANRTNPSSIAQGYNPNQGNTNTYSSYQTERYPPTAAGANNAAMNGLTFSQYIARNPSIQPGSSQYQSLQQQYQDRIDRGGRQHVYSGEGEAGVARAGAEAARNGLTFPELVSTIVRPTLDQSPFYYGVRENLTSPQRLQILYDAYRTTAEQVSGVQYPAQSPIGFGALAQVPQAPVGRPWDAPSAPPLPPSEGSGGFNPSAPPLPPPSEGSGFYPG